MSTEVRWRRGTAAQNDAFTGALAEITVDTTNSDLRIHDGATPGGKGILARVPPVGPATIAEAEALTPDVAPDYIRTAGYAAAGDGGGALYKKVASEPAHAGKFSLTLSDGVTVVWYELPRIVADPMAFAMGVYINDGVSRPLSLYFSTLAEAQSVYPHATALTDQLAWAACQAAVTVLEENRFGGSVSYGGTLELPRGTLNFGSNTLRIVSDYVNVNGAPYQGTRINRSATTGYAIHFAKAAVGNLFYVGLSNVQIVSTVAMTAGGLVLFDIANFSMIRDCRLVNGYVNLHCRSVHDFHIENVNGVHGAPYAVGNSAFANLYLDTQTAAGSFNPTNNGWISNCNFRSFVTDDGYCAHGIYISSADGLWFDHCHIGNGETANLTIIPKAGTTQLSGVTMSNCWFDQGGNGRMVNIGGATSATFGYFQFADCYLTGGATCTDGWRIDPSVGSVVRFVEITGGKVLNLKGHGLIANRLEGLVMSGTQIRNVGTSGGGGTGMTFGATCKNLTITGVAAGYAGNLSTAALSSYGIVIATGVNEYIITGCNLRGNATGGLSDGGGPNKVVANNLV